MIVTTKTKSRQASARRGLRRQSSGGSPPSDVLHTWSGTTARFSRLIEGGPGRVGTLLILTAIIGLTFWQGIHLTESSGIDSAGPALILVAGSLGTFLLAWLLIKAVLRSTAVVFYVSDRGVGVLPSIEQRQLDASIRWVTTVAFWLTWKGGQWSSWEPFTVWNQVRQVEATDANHEILVVGGPWDIRLACTAVNYDTVRNLIRERLCLIDQSCVFIRRESLGTAMPRVG
jgi:hypothetical protein